MTWTSTIGLFMVVALVGAILWRRRLPFWVRLVLVLLGMVAMALTLLRSMELL
jgi:hypothetical protein